MACLNIGSEPNLEYWRSPDGQWAQPVASINYPCGHATVWQAGSRYRYQLETPEGRVVHVSVHESLSLEECAHRSVRALEAYDEGLRGYNSHREPHHVSDTRKLVGDDPYDEADRFGLFFSVAIVFAVIALGLVWAMGGGF